jgi:hypothetical protein
MMWQWWNDVLLNVAGSAAPARGWDRITLRGMLDSHSAIVINADADFGCDVPACHRRASPFRPFGESSRVKAVVHERGIRKPLSGPNLRRVRFPIR